jgi:hypothetical protein
LLLALLAGKEAGKGEREREGLGEHEVEEDEGMEDG